MNWLSQRCNERVWLAAYCSDKKKEMFFFCLLKQKILNQGSFSFICHSIFPSSFFPQNIWLAILLDHPQLFSLFPVGGSLSFYFWLVMVSLCDVFQLSFFLYFSLIYLLYDYSVSFFFFFLVQKYSAVVRHCPSLPRIYLITKIYRLCTHFR